MERTELKLFSLNFINDLLRNVKNGIIQKYLGAEKFDENYNYAKGKSEIYLTEGFSLNISYTKATSLDLENSILIYENLGPLNEVQASDIRLWVTLTHTCLWEYMQSRWPVSEEASSRVMDRYFVKQPNLQCLTRNGISRLWWYAHLTKDESNSVDKYKLTRALLKRQEIAVGLLERTFGTNANIRIAILEFLLDNAEISGNEDRTRELFKKINLVGGVKNLPFLSKDEIKHIVLDRIKLEI